MLSDAFSLVVAQLPESLVYVSVLKLLAITAMFLAWVLFAQWVDKDTVAVNTYRTIWNLVSVVVGVLSFVVLLVIPLFWAAAAAWAILNLSFMLSYVIHRNGLVVDEDKVCTPAHLQRLLSGKGKREKLLDVNERVVIRDASDRTVKLPTEPAERQQFALAQDLFFDLLARRCNRLDMTPAGQALKLRQVVDGIAADRDPMPRAEGDALIQYLKHHAGLRLDERRKPQRGKMALHIGQTRYQLIVKTNGSTAGENMVLLVLGEERSFKMKDLGFTPEQLQIMERFKEREHGLVVFTGPPQNGVTTTLYSLARTHDAFLQNIQTVELEREIELENVTQHIFTPTEEKPFSAEVQRVIRSDPDVLFVMNVPDKQTAALLSTAASQKINAYTGIRANDAIDGLRRWIGQVGDPGLVAKSLVGVSHQRLIRKLCEACKTAYKPDPATLKKINMPADKVLYRVPEPQYDKRGEPIICPACQGSGYVGRTAVFTILEVDAELRDVIRKGGALPDVKAVVQKRGSQGLQQQALHKVFEGVTSIDEVVRATRPVAERPARTAGAT